MTGGFLPNERRGKSESGIIHICDWERTFCEMIGVNPFDPTASKYHYPQIDGLNVWPMISGQNETSPRNEIPISANALIQGQYKYLNGNVGYASWEGMEFPNSSSPQHPVQGTTMNCDKGCLFDLQNDMTEHQNIASQNPQIVQTMSQRLNELKKGFYSNKLSQNHI